MKVSVFLTAGLYACCTTVFRTSGDKPYIKGIVSSVPDDMKSMISRVVQMGDRESDGVFLREGDYPIVIGYGKLGDKVLGLSAQYYGRCDVTLTDQYDWKDDIKFESTLIHEIAHCYGYDHVDAPLDVMYPSHNPNITHEIVVDFLRAMGRQVKR